MLPCGVPQGSVLHKLIFSTIINKSYLIDCKECKSWLDVDLHSLSLCQSDMLFSYWLPRRLLMGAGCWDSRCDASTSSSNHSSPTTQVRRWGRYRGHGGGHPSHRGSLGWGVFCTTFCPHPYLLQRDLCLSYLVGGGLPAHQQPVRHLLSPVSDAELSWGMAPVCRLCTLRQSNPAPEEKALELHQHTPGMFMPLRVWSWLKSDVFGPRQRKCWSIDYDAVVLKQNSFATLKSDGQCTEGRFFLLLQIESLNFEELAVIQQLKLVM